MCNIFSCCKEKSKNLSDQEREDIANKRVQYLENKYPPQKPIDSTKKMDIIMKEDKRHEQYIKDLRD